MDKKSRRDDMIIDNALMNFVNPEGGDTIIDISNLTIQTKIFRCIEYIFANMFPP